MLQNVSGTRRQGILKLLNLCESHRKQMLILMIQILLVPEFCIPIFKRDTTKLVQKGTISYDFSSGIIIKGAKVSS